MNKSIQLKRTTASTSFWGLPLTMEEYKSVQLEILKYTAQFCEEHHLRYFLADGTLIGAVRHKGYIPWDDDIDIRMPRPDLMKLIEVFNDQSSSGRYELVSPLMKKAQHYMVKIIDTETVKIEPYLDYSNGFLGADIDVFPLDGCPEDEEKFYAWGKQIRALNRAYTYKKRAAWRTILSRGKDILYKRVHAKICPFISAAQIAERVSQLSLQYSYDDSKFACFIGAGELYRVPKECFENYISVPFETEFFRIPTGYDQVLRARYGDYLTLPPENERKTHHTNNVFWKRGASQHA